MPTYPTSSVIITTYLSLLSSPICPSPSSSSSIIILGTLNLIPLIFRAFSSDKTLARSVNQLLSSVNVAAKSLTSVTGGKGKGGGGPAGGSKAITTTKGKQQQKGKGASEGGAGAGPTTASGSIAASPVNTLLGSCYTIHAAIPYFKRVSIHS